MIEFSNQVSHWVAAEIVSCSSSKVISIKSLDIEIGLFMSRTSDLHNLNSIIGKTLLT